MHPKSESPSGYVGLREPEYLVAKLRLHYVSWREIAELLGISPQLAHYRFRHVTREGRKHGSRQHS